MSLWFGEPTLAELNDRSRDNLADHLGMEFTAVDERSLSARMPVDHRTRQPYGLLHGGASVALAETLGSVAASLCLDPQRYRCVGMEINANHLRPVRSGFVTGCATPLHIGPRTQVWEVRITDRREHLVCISRITLAVVRAR